MQPESDLHLNKLYSAVEVDIVSLLSNWSVKSLTGRLLLLLVLKRSLAVAVTAELLFQFMEKVSTVLPNVIKIKYIRR